MERERQETYLLDFGFIFLLLRLVGLLEIDLEIRQGKKQNLVY